MPKDFIEETKLNGLSPDAIRYLCVRPSALKRDALSRHEALCDLMKSCGEPARNLPDGQTLVDFSLLSKKWGWSRNTVSAFIQALEKFGLILSRKTDCGMLLTLNCDDGFMFATEKSRRVAGWNETQSMVGKWAVGHLSKEDMAKFIEEKLGLMPKEKDNLVVGFFLCSMVNQLVSAIKKCDMMPADPQLASRLSSLFFGSLNASSGSFVRLLSCWLLCLAEDKSPSQLAQMKDVSPSVLAQIDALFWLEKDLRSSKGRE